MVQIPTVEEVSYKAGEISGKIVATGENVAHALKLDALAKSAYEKTTNRSLEQDQKLAAVTVMATAGPVTDAVADKLSNAAAAVIGKDAKDIKETGLGIAAKYKEGFIKGRTPELVQEPISTPNSE